MSNKMKITFNGFAELVEKLDRITRDAKPAIDEALQETKKMITTNADEAMIKHNKTFATEKSLIKDNQIEWSGTIATVSVGFSIRHGGLPSIFLMYGTPKIKKDQKLYSAFKGAKTKKDIEAIQRQVMMRYMTLGKG